jgi:hypothetical protein
LLSGVEAMLAATAGPERRVEERITRVVELGKGFGHFPHTADAIGSAYALMNKPKPAPQWLRAAADDGFPCYPLFETDSSLIISARPTFHQIHGHAQETMGALQGPRCRAFKLDTRVLGRLALAELDEIASRRSAMNRRRSLWPRCRTMAADRLCRFVSVRAPR